MGKAGRVQGRVERSTEVFVAPAKRAADVLFAEAKANDSTPLKSGVVLWSAAPVVFRLDASLLDALFGSDLKTVPPGDALAHLPFGCFVVAFDEPVEVWDDDDKLTRVFEGFMVSGVAGPISAGDGRTFLYAVPLSHPNADNIRGTFYGSFKETGRSQVVTATIPGIHGNVEGQRTLEEMFDDSFFDEADITSFDAAGRSVIVDAAEFTALGTFAQGGLRGPLTQLLWQVLLYLSSPEPDIREVVPPDGAERTSFRYLVSSGKSFELGWRVGASLREAYRGTDVGVQGHGLQTRPHVRRGHWHTYLYGRRGGVSERRLKWVHPLVVNRELGPVGGVVHAVGIIDSNASEVGVTYRHADENMTPEFTGEYLANPDLRGRGARAHARLQNMVSDALVRRGRVPLSPSVNDPQFDVAWREGDSIVVVEVKSLSDISETHQLRLGVGQVIEYRWNLAAALLMPVRSVLLVEREPTGASWAELCRDEQIVLTWPEILDVVLDELFVG